MTRRAAVYCRISSDREGAGLGVDRQEQDCRELASRLGWTVAAVHADNDLSASNGKPRPGYLALLGDLRAGRADGVLAWHTDRLHRSPVELEEYIAVCEPRGAPTHCVKAGPLDLATPSGRMVARMLGAAARFEVEHASERVRRARVQAAMEGRWAGGTRPYGYAPDGMTVVEVEAGVVREAAARVLAGGSLGALARELNDRGLRTTAGGLWRAGAVRRVLLSARNAGLAAYRGEVLGRARWPAILDEDTWRAVAGVLTDPGRRTRPGREPRWLLSGLACCGVCGSAVRSTSSAGRPTYICRTGKHLARDAHQVDSYVTAVIVERLSRPDAVDLLTRDVPVDTGPLFARRLALRGRLDGLAVAYGRDEIDAGQLAHGSGVLRAELGAVDAAIAEVGRTSALAGVVDQPDPAAVWAGLSLDRRRAVVDTLVQVTILPARKGRRPGWQPGQAYFDPVSVRVKPKRAAAQGG